MSEQSASASTKGKSPAPNSEADAGSSQPSKSNGKSTLQRDAIERELQEAKGRFDELRERIAEGDSDVTGSDLADAESAVELAKLRLDAVEEHERRRREHARVTRVGQIRASLLDGHLADEAAELIKLSAQARAALDELYEAADRHTDEVRAALVELAGLDPLPDDIQLSTGLGGGPPSSVLVDGTRVHLIRDLPSKVVVDTALQVVSEHKVSQDVVSDLRRHAGPVGIGAGQMLATEHLAKQYGVNGHGGS